MKHRTQCSSTTLSPWPGLRTILFKCIFFCLSFRLLPQVPCTSFPIAFILLKYYLRLIALVSVSSHLQLRPGPLPISMYLSIIWYSKDSSSYFAPSYITRNHLSHFGCLPQGLAETTDDINMYWSWSQKKERDLKRKIKKSDFSKEERTFPLSHNPLFFPSR